MLLSLVWSGRPGQRFIRALPLAGGRTAKGRGSFSTLPPAAVMAAEEPIEECRASAADMQEAGGRGGETGDDRHDFLVMMLLCPGIDGLEWPRSADP